VYDSSPDRKHGLAASRWLLGRGDTHVRRYAGGLAARAVVGNPLEGDRGVVRVPARVPGAREDGAHGERASGAAVVAG
jgi:hypothetical protein